MIKHLMLDFETLGSSHDAAVVSLGAVLFDRSGIKEERLWLFNLKGQLDSRRRVASGDTIAWWMKQEKAAREVFEQAQTQGIYLQAFSHEFLAFCPQTLDVRVWGNGATFDIPIIESILNQCGAPIPWKFWNHRCYRTLKSCYGIERGAKFEGTKHSALDDAKHQAKQLIAYWNGNQEKGLDK